jgi:hypothetical protein
MLRRNLFMTSTRTIAWVAGVLLVAATPAASQTFDLAVKRPHLVGTSHGTLVIGDQGVEYRTADKADARRWTYVEIKQIQVQSPTRIVVRTYEDQGWTRLWADRAFEFEVEKGQITAVLAAFLLAKIPRPVVTAVLPPLTGTARYRVPVKHERGRRGSSGELALYDDALVYESMEAGASRYWRFGDLVSVYALDRFRLEVLTYEGGGGDTRSFSFLLKTDLPPGFSDRLWAILNAPPPLRQASGR